MKVRIRETVDVHTNVAPVSTNGFLMDLAGNSRFGADVAWAGPAFLHGQNSHTRKWEGFTAQEHT